MNWIFIIIGIFFLTGILLLLKQSPYKKISRNDFLTSLAKVTESTVEPLTNHTNSFKIPFKFEERNFSYEDIETPGFNTKIYKSYLKIKTSTNLNLTFSEKKSKKIIQNKIIMASEIPDKLPPKETKINLPKRLNALDVHTNNARHTQDLLKDTKAAQIFFRFKYLGLQGAPYVALKILDGMIILEFQSTQSYKPRPLSEHNNLKLLEGYLDKLILLTKKVEEYK